MVKRSNSPQAWRAALPIARDGGGWRFRTLATVPLNGASVTAAEVNSTPGIWIPAWLFTGNRRTDGRSALLVLDDRGRNAHAHEDDLYHRVTRAGRLVCAADIRGIADTQPEVGRGNPAYTIPHDAEEEFAWASLIFGMPLLGQRISDIVALAHALRKEAPGNLPVAIAARGHLTVPALFACAASEDIGSLYLAGGLVSYRSLLESEIYHHPLSNFAWSLFKESDLPLVAAQSAPRPIYLAGVVDGGKLPMKIEQVRAVYPFENIRFSAEPAWDEDSLGSA